MDAMEENVHRMQYFLSLLKQQSQSVKLDPVRLVSMADTVKGVAQWLDENIHASTEGIVASNCQSPS